MHHQVTVTHQIIFVLTRGLTLFLNRNKELEETKEKLKETEEELATTKRTLEETRTESAAMKVSFEKVISDLEEELYDETIQKERLLKVKAELEAEVASLRWYFQPLGTYLSMFQTTYHIW